MGKKKIYQCAECIQLFSGRTTFDYHMNAHKRTALPKPREVAPKPRPTCYTDGDGEPPRTAKETA